MGRGLPRRAPPEYVRGDEDAPALPKVRDELLRPDEEYAVTMPGERLFVGFATTAPDDQSERTYFLASQGYYIEWIRGHWIRDDLHGRPFEPTPAALHTALGRWLEVKDDFEPRFFSQKIHIR